MRLSNKLFLFTLAIGACSHDTGAGTEDGWVVAPKTDCPSVPDMATPRPKCAAANGLAGDNLICVDFTSLTDQPLSNTATLPAVLKDWNFASICSNSQTGMPAWEIKNKKLVIKNFDMFLGSCGFTMPTIDSQNSDFKNHNKFTLSVVQKLNLSKSTPQQTMGIYLNAPLDGYQVWLSTGMSPRQVSTVTIEKMNFPSGTNGYQPVFQLTAANVVGGTSVEIESIAVNASQ